MTFTYSSQVASVKLLGLLRLLKLWRASVYKLVFREILVFLVLYFALSCLYRFVLNAYQRREFEKLVVYSGTSESLMPVTFVLGFYVSVVVQRWWSQFVNIAWPDRIMAYISVLVTGRDEHSRMLRRTMIRYLMLAEVLLLMTVSAPIKKRFPNLESLVEQGLMTKEELKIYNDSRVPHIAQKYWVPCQWCAILMGRARDEKRIRDSYELVKLLEELTDYKNCLKAIFTYDWVSLPLVYTQVATVAVYTFFFNAIISRQFISYQGVRDEFDPDTAVRYAIDMYVPLEAIMQLFFYLGWLKVAEQMLNPFGEDDDDFECNFILDRNLQVGLFSVDRSLSMQPKLQRDVWWDSDSPRLEYTDASKKFAMTGGWFGSTADLAVPMPDTSLPQHSWLPSIPEMSVLPNGGDVTDGDAADGATNGGYNLQVPASPRLQASVSVFDVSRHQRKISIFASRGRRRVQTSTAAHGCVSAPARNSAAGGSGSPQFGSTPDALGRTGDGAAGSRRSSFEAAGTGGAAAAADDAEDGKSPKETVPLVAELSV